MSNWTPRADNAGQVQADLGSLAMGTYTVIALDAEGRPLARTRLVKY